MSTVTVLGLNVAYLLSGVVITESVFVIPGAGSLIVQAVVGRDYPLVQALAVVFATLVVMVNTLTDVAYGWLDPRVRL
jgi:peptide/nickel transport system permease protein